MKENTKSWKKALLKSSLPLELLVGEILYKNSVNVNGEYTYLRMNEQGANTEFSIDLWGNKLFNNDGVNWLNLNFLVECKYNSPGIRWLFAPYTNNEDIYAGVLSVFQDLCTKRIDDDPLYDLDQDLFYCFKGIELHSDNANPNSIIRGLSQLRYGIPHQVKRIIIKQLLTKHDDDLIIEVICPILITTSELYVIKTGLDLNCYQNANELEEIATKVESLVCYQPIGSHLLDYALDISKDMQKKYSHLKNRIDAYHKVFMDKGIPEHKIIQNWEIDTFFTYSIERILVVSFEHFEKKLKDICAIVNQTYASLESIADLETIIQSSPSANEMLAELAKKIKFT